MFFGYGLASMALVIFALVHFIKYRSGNWIWLYVIIFLGPIGAIVYLIVETIVAFVGGGGIRPCGKSAGRQP